VLRERREKCGDQGDNATALCPVSCLFETMIGDKKEGRAPLTKDEVVAPFVIACLPAQQPYPSPPPPPPAPPLALCRMPWLWILCSSMLALTMLFCFDGAQISAFEPGGCPNPRPSMPLEE
jgi:hypothetical protein